MEKLQLLQFMDYLAPRARTAHKGDFGHVLVVGGDLGYAGAARLAAEAALRVGAGLVSIATRPEHAITLNLTRPEIMCHGVNTPAELAVLLEKADVLIVGPGLGQSTWSQVCFAPILALDKPIILDADGLNWLAKAPVKKSNWILTPHPGEAGRLLKQITATIQQERGAALKLLQQTYGGVVVLKGAGSLVLGPDGEPAICLAGNPGMATAGMGDILSGVIGGLVAQKIPLLDAAKLGVLLHAMAGDAAAKTGERGIIASDLLPHLYKLVNRL